MLRLSELRPVKLPTGARGLRGKGNFMVTAVEHYINILIKLAQAKGRILAPLDAIKLERRFNEADATLFADGLDRGLLSIDANGYLVTRDPYQATAWLVERIPARPGLVRPCWEYLSHGAGYVELIDRLQFPSWAVRFETPDSEHNIGADLAVLDRAGRVLIMGEAKTEARELDKLLVQLKQYCEVDPGPPPPRHRDKAAWKLAHRLWITRAPWLWLVAPGDRRTFEVSYQPLALQQCDALPEAEEFGFVPSFDAEPPRMRLPDLATP